MGHLLPCHDPPADPGGGPGSGQARPATSGIICCARFRAIHGRTRSGQVSGYHNWKSSRIELQPRPAPGTSCSSGLMPRRSPGRRKQPGLRLSRESPSALPPFRDPASLVRIFLRFIKGSPLTRAPGRRNGSETSVPAPLQQRKACFPDQQRRKRTRQAFRERPVGGPDLPERLNPFLPAPATGSLLHGAARKRLSRGDDRGSEPFPAAPPALTGLAHGPVPSQVRQHVAQPQGPSGAERVVPPGEALSRLLAAVLVAAGTAVLDDVGLGAETADQRQLAAARQAVRQRRRARSSRPAPRDARRLPCQRRCRSRPSPGR